MEKYSSLSSKGLRVSVEQVSMFLTEDGTIISFFENSADDVEYAPLPWYKLRDGELTRLQTTNPPKTRVSKYYSPLCMRWVNDTTSNRKHPLFAAIELPDRVITHELG